MNISIKTNDTVVILTGAGISAESGIKTFRDNNGLWEEYNVYEVATPEAFQSNPSRVWSFYNMRRQALRDVVPNKAHYAVTDFQEIFPNTHIVTQNVDDLHERAGNVNIIHMHGTLSAIRCISCNYRRDDLDIVEGVPLCPKCGSPLRPDIVWFGEMPYFMERIMHLLSQCTLFMGIGTSGTVYPAAGFIDIAKQFGAKTLFVNKEPIINPSVDIMYTGNAGKLLKGVFNEIIQSL